MTAVDFNPSYLLDLFRNSIRLLKRPFLASFLMNFSTICLHMLSKFIKKSYQKWLVFPIKANFERSLKNCVWVLRPIMTCDKNRQDTVY